MELSKISGITKATTVDLDFDGILELIRSQGYSGSTFRNGHRCLDNFEETSLVIMDVDENLSIHEAKKRLIGYKHILALTRNHQKIKYTKAGKEKPACDRFRIILFLDGKITRKEDYKHTCHQLLNIFPELDPSCSEASRFFYASTQIEAYSEQGRLVEIAIAPEQTITARTDSTKLLGKLSSKTMDFLNNGAEQGTWNNRLFSASLDLNEQNYPREAALAMLSAIDQPLDDSDMSTFDSAFDREAKYAPRDGILRIAGFEDETTRTGGGEPPTRGSYEGLTIPFYTSNLRCWLDEFFEENNITMEETDDIVVRGKRQPFDKFRNMLYIATGEAKKYKYDSKGEQMVDKFKNPIVVPTGIGNRAVVDSYINKWVDEERARVLDTIRDKIAFTGHNDEALKFVNTMTNVNVEITTAIIRQFIYNVKLKLMRIHPKFIIMPVFFGNQGVGKSMAIKKLLEPIKYMSAPATFNICHDERENKGTFGSKLALEFDEMSAANKADIEAVKNKITSERVGFRILGANQNSNMFNMASLIGSSNTSILDLLYDDTGKRRFYEVVCRNDAFWEDIESINSLAIWQSVDTNEPPPIREHFAGLTKIQAGYKNLNSVEEFLIDEDLIPEEGDVTFNIVKSDLYKRYADTMSLQKRGLFKKTKFYIICRSLLEEQEGRARQSTFVVKGDQ